MAFGCVKSKSAVNWLFIFWKTGSCTVACARRARLSDAAEENAPLTELETLSVDIENGVSIYNRARRRQTVISYYTTVLTHDEHSISLKKNHEN